jgi:hypothetical protein
MPATDIRESVTKIVFAPHEIAEMQSVIEAVCLELGVTTRERKRRQGVADRVVAAYRGGRRLPLNMVHAGLAEHRA